MDLFKVQLPFPEDIYDLDTFELQDLQNNLEKILKQEKQFIEQQLQQTADQQQYFKKSKKIQTLIQQELNERKATEDLGIVCEKKEIEFFSKLEHSYHNKLKQNLEDWTSILNEQIKLQDSKVISQSIIPQNQSTKIPSQHYNNIQQQQQQQQQQINLSSSQNKSQKQQKPQTQNQYDQNNSYNVENTFTHINPSIINNNKLINQSIEISGKQKNINQRDQSPNTDSNSFLKSNLSDNRSKLSNFSGRSPKRNKKKDMMQEFIKNTLQATKITDNNMVIGKGSVGNYKPPKAQAISQDTKPANEKDYKNVQSKVKQNLKDQDANKPQNVYYSSGKPAFSNKYQPNKKPIKKQKTQSEQQIDNSHEYEINEASLKNNKKTKSSSVSKHTPVNHNHQDENSSKSSLTNTQQTEPLQKKKNQKKNKALSETQQQSSTGYSHNSRNDGCDSDLGNNNTNNTYIYNTQQSSDSKSDINNNKIEQKVSSNSSLVSSKDTINNKNQQNQSKDNIVINEQKNNQNNNNIELLEQQYNKVWENVLPLQQLNVENIKIVNQVNKQQNKQEEKKESNINIKEKQSQSLNQIEQYPEQKDQDDECEENKVQFQQEEDKFTPQPQIFVQDPIQEDIQENMDVDESMVMEKNKITGKKELKKKIIYRNDTQKQKQVPKISSSEKEQAQQQVDISCEDLSQNKEIILNTSQSMKQQQKLSQSQIGQSAQAPQAPQLTQQSPQKKTEKEQSNTQIKLTQEQKKAQEQKLIEQQKLEEEQQSILKEQEQQKMLKEQELLDDSIDKEVEDGIDSPTIIEEKNRLKNMLKIITNPQIRKEMRMKLKEIIQIKKERRKYKQEQEQEDLQKKSQEQQNYLNNNNNVGDDVTIDNNNLQNNDDNIDINNKPEEKKILKKKKIKQTTLTFEQLQMKKIRDSLKGSELVDYSDLYQTFEMVFSGHYFGDFKFLDTMKELQILFEQNIQKMAQQEPQQKQMITPLDVTGNEAYYYNDPKQVIVYSNRVNINIKKFIERQIIQTKRLQQLSSAMPIEGQDAVNNDPKNTLYYRVVKNKQEVYNIITRSFLRKENWDELPSGKNLKTSWNMLWTWSKPNVDITRLLVWQKVNHFQFNKNLVRKDLLKQNIQRITKQGSHLSKLFDITPLTFVLPKEYINFSEAFGQNQKIEGIYNYWIMKPVGKSQGRGIQVINDISQVLSTEPVVVQKYIKNPLLLDRHKFDLRIYVLVTSFNPLEAFIFHEGFARITTEEFSIHPEDIKNNQIHLTNYAIQKHYYDPSQMNNYIGGTKITLKILQDKFATLGIDWTKIWEQIKEIVIKSLISCQLDIPYQPNAFEVFGYDILIDQNLKCLLIEINSSPSMATDFIIDDLVKQQMIDDSIDLVNAINFDKEKLIEVLERRIREALNQNEQSNTTEQLNLDLNYILKGQKIRKYGELPSYLGNYEMIVPGIHHDKIIKQMRNQKFNSQQQKPNNIPTQNFQMPQIDF